MRALVLLAIFMTISLSLIAQKDDIIVGFDGLKPLKGYTNIFVYSYKMELLYVEDGYKGETLQSFKKRIEKRQKPQNQKKVIKEFLSLEELNDSLIMAYINEPSSDETLISSKEKETCKLFLSSLVISVMANALILTVVVLSLRKK